MSQAYQEPSAGSSPSGTQAGTSADESRGGSTTDTGPFPSKIWTRYGYQIDERYGYQIDERCGYQIDGTLFCPGDAATYSPEDVRQKIAEDSGVPLESVKVTRLSEYKANDETSQWDASYYNGAEAQGRKCLSLEPFTANASVPDELVDEIEEEKERIEGDKQILESLNDVADSIERLAESWFSWMEGDQTSDNGQNDDL